jgi:transcriptional regulator with XRE-family HTH domain
MSFFLRTVQEVQRGIAERFKARRLARNLTQKELAARSGVTVSSLKRFEREGLIALDSLLSLALALDCLDDFDKLAAKSQPIPTAQSLDDLLAAPTSRRRATGRKGRTHGV